MFVYFQNMDIVSTNRAYNVQQNGTFSAGNRERDHFLNVVYAADPATMD